MHPIRITENIMSSSSTMTASSAGGLRGEVPKGLIFTSREPEVAIEPEFCDDSSASSGNPLYHGDGTHSNSSIIIRNNNNTDAPDCGDNKGRFPHRHPHAVPVTSKEVMKTINDGAAPYLSNKQTPGSSTSKIVDQALDVVKSKGASGRHSHDASNTKCTTDGDATQSSPGTCHTTSHNVCTNSTNTTAASSQTVSSHGPLSPEVATTTSEPNLIAPSLRKIAKKRRKEPDKNGMERSSFHHTKSSKEYLRKAQEALKQQQQQQQQDLFGSSTSSTSAESASDRTAENMHSPRTNFRMLSQVNVEAVRGSLTAPFFSRSQSCSSVVAGIKSPEEDASNNPYGYEDPDVAAASKSGNSNPYGYEDPDANATRILPADRRMGPARRRGSVTKYSLQAAQAAQKATERIMRLQGLNWKGNSENPAHKNGGMARSTTPTGRRSHPRHAMESTTPETNNYMDQSVIPLPVRRRSIPMDNWENEPGAVAPMNPLAESSRFADDPVESSDPYGYETTAMAEDDVVCKHPSEVSSSSNPYGYEDRDATTASNPYGYGDNDTLPRQPIRRHPRARRRGSVTKFSLDAAKTVASFEPENSTPPVVSSEPENSSPPEESRPVDMLEGSEDFVMALKPPAAGRPVGLAPKNRRRVGLFSGDLEPESNGGVLQLRRNNSSSSDQASPRRTAPRRSGSARSASSRHLARFGAPGRSDSFLSHGSAASWEDDADSLAPDMESLCSIHDRGDLGFDLAPVPQLSHTFSGKSDNGLHRNAPESQRSFSERNHCTVVTFPADSDFAILPFATSGGDSRSSARMPAPPIRRAPSHSTSGTSTSLPSHHQSTSVSSQF